VLQLPTHTVAPITRDMFKMGAVRDFSAEVDGTVRVFLEAAADANRTLEMTNFWSVTESPHADMVAQKTS
jgi:hypothetical protein